LKMKTGYWFMVLLPVLEPSKRTWNRNLEILSSGFERISNH
jgi:hypothetical protein